MNRRIRAKWNQRHFSALQTHNAGLSVTDRRSACMVLRPVSKLGRDHSAMMVAFPSPLNLNGRRAESVSDVAIADGTMYVYAVGARPIEGCVIIGHEQPSDYVAIPWPTHAPADRLW